VAGKSGVSLDFTRGRFAETFGRTSVGFHFWHFKLSIGYRISRLKRIPDDRTLIDCYRWGL
jgi:hypothetical protein